MTLKIPGRSGESEHIVCSYKNFEELVADRCYFGCTVGRYANRIARGRFSLDQVEYQLTLNDGANSLHGGDGFDKRVWKCVESSDTAITFRLDSCDGDAGYPGNLVAEATFELFDQSLVLSYSATTDKPMVVNLTNHAYFNLSGVGRGDVSRHLLKMKASTYLPVDKELIPTGELASVIDSAYNFTISKPVGIALQQLPLGIDHCYAFDNVHTGGSQIELFDPDSGRVLEIITSQPAVQLYTGNFLDGSIEGVGGAYKQYGALCLETQ